MIAYIRYDQGEGSANVYCRLRKADGKYWDFVALGWVTSLTADCKTYLAEVNNDSDPSTSLYCGSVTVPDGGPWIQEVVTNDDNTMIGYGHTMENDIAAILTDTATTIPALIAALNDPTAAAIATAVIDSTIETQGTITLQQALSIIVAAVAGVTSNSGLTFKTPDGNATRITSSVDGDSNRTGITLNPSS